MRLSFLKRKREWEDVFLKDLGVHGETMLQSCKALKFWEGCMCGWLCHLIFSSFVFSILFVAQLQLFIVIHYGRNWANISSILELFFNSSSSIIPHSFIGFHLLCNLPKKLSISHNLIDGENCKILNKTQLPKGRNPQGTSSPPTISWIKMFFFHLHLPMFPVARHLLMGKAIISLRQMASNALPWGKSIL